MNLKNECDVSNTSYYVEIESGALLQDIVQSQKIIHEGHGKSLKIFRQKVWELRHNQDRDYRTVELSVQKQTFHLCLCSCCRVVHRKARTGTGVSPRAARILSQLRVNEPAGGCTRCSEALAGRAAVDNRLSPVVSIFCFRSPMVAVMLVGYLVYNDS